MKEYLPKVINIDSKRNSSEGIKGKTLSIGYDINQRRKTEAVFASKKRDLDGFPTKQ